MSNLMRRALLPVAAVAAPAAIVWAALAATSGGEGVHRPPRVLPEMPATSNALSGTKAQNTPDLAVDPTNERFAVVAHRMDTPQFGCDLQVSGDGGRTWVGADPVPDLPKEADMCYAPDVAFDADGRLYFMFVGLKAPSNTPTGVYLTTSDTHARTFTTPQRLLGRNNYQARLAIDADAGRIYLVWLHAAEDPPTGGFPPTRNPILAAWSDDGAQTFSEPVEVADADRQRVVGPAVAIAPDGTLYVAYYDLREDVRDYQGLPGPPWQGEWSLVVTRSRDEGRSFEPGVEVDDGLIPADRVILIFTMPPPALTTGEDGRVFVAWHDARRGDSDVFFSRSGNGGRAWAEPLRLNDDPPGNGATQYLPQIATAPDDRIDAIFYDRRDDRRDILNHVYYTYSTTSGRTFEPNLRVTSRSGSSRVGQRYLVPSSRGRNDIGSRLALVSTDARALAAWADTRNAPFTPYQDVFTTSIVHRSESGGLPLWPAAIFGAAAVAAVAGWLARPRRGQDQGVGGGPPAPSQGGAAGGGAWEAAGRLSGREAPRESEPGGWASGRPGDAGGSQ